MMQQEPKFLLEQHMSKYKQQHSGFSMDTQCATSVPAFRVNYISQSPSLWLKYTGPLRILRTECVWIVSESFFSFYIDYPSQKQQVELAFYQLKLLCLLS